MGSGYTQPRCIAAWTLAGHVLEEVGDGSLLDETIGYKEATMLDPLLLQYSVIMIDKVHTRNLNTDALLDMVEKIQRKQ
eukprot:6991533-Ditylum_brightwellii.AAC.1